MMTQENTSSVQIIRGKDSRIRIPSNIFRNTVLTINTEATWVGAQAFTATHPHKPIVVFVLLTNEFDVVLPTTIFCSDTTIDANGNAEKGRVLANPGEKVLWFTPTTFEEIRVPAMAVFKECVMEEWFNRYFQPSPSDSYICWERDDLDGGLSVPA